MTYNVLFADLGIAFVDISLVNDDLTSEKNKTPMSVCFYRRVDKMFISRTLGKELLITHDAIICKHNKPGTDHPPPTYADCCKKFKLQNKLSESIISHQNPEARKKRKPNASDTLNYNFSFRTHNGLQTNTVANLQTKQRVVLDGLRGHSIIIRPARKSITRKSTEKTSKCFSAEAMSLAELTHTCMVNLPTSRTLVTLSPQLVVWSVPRVFLKIVELRGVD